MMAILDAVRDALVSLALAWIGVAVEPAAEPAPAQSGSSAAACGAKNKSSAACANRAPSFETQTCTHQ
jgi:hypothetical protein